MGALRKLQGLVLGGAAAVGAEAPAALLAGLRALREPLNAQLRNKPSEKPRNAPLRNKPVPPRSWKPCVKRKPPALLRPNGSRPKRAPPRKPPPAQHNKQPRKEEQLPNGQEKT